jgi:hypothetical protein
MKFFVIVQLNRLIRSDQLRAIFNCLAKPFFNLLRNLVRLTWLINNSLCHDRLRLNLALLQMYKVARRQNV